MSCSCHPTDHDPARSRSSLGRRTVLAGALAAGLVPFLPTPVAGGSGTADDEGFDSSPGVRDFGFLPPRPATEVHQQNIMYPVLDDPVLGKTTWSDTYLAPRSNGRLHEGQDLMGRKMLKLLACVDGTIVELRHTTTGNSLYLRGTDGYYYCYLHINNDTPGTDDGSNQFANAFAPGMAVGRSVQRGEHLAYLGDSGNAEATGSHCHFEIRLPNANWYNAAACNAAYSLRAAAPARLRPPLEGPYAPAPNATAFAQRQADDFLGAVPSQAWLYTSVRDLDRGVVTPNRFVENQLASGRVQGFTNPVIRLYLAYFGGVPTYDGVNYWVRQCRAGMPLDTASALLADSAKFAQVGPLSNEAFARRIMVNLRGDEPSAATLAALTAQLDSGTTRGALVRQQCEDRAYRALVASKVRVLTVYHAMVRRAPEERWWSTWAERDRTDPGGMAALIEAHRSGAEYQRRWQG